MTLSVIDAGFGRTGTLPFKVVLETLGEFPRVNYQEEFWKTFGGS